MALALRFKLIGGQEEIHELGEWLKSLKIFPELRMHVDTWHYVTSSFEQTRVRRLYRESDHSAQRLCHQEAWHVCVASVLMLELHLVFNHSIEILVNSFSAFTVTKASLVKAYKVIAFLCKLLSEISISPSVVTIAMNKLYYTFSFTNRWIKVALKVQHSARPNVFPLVLYRVDNRPIVLAKIDIFFPKQSIFLT